MLVRNAFETGSGLEVSLLYQLINVLIVGVVFLWAAWTALGTFQLWAQGNATALQLIATLFRILLVLSVMLFIL